MNSFDRFRSPLKNARGLGSAKDGVHHFIAQRVTAVALLFLSIYFIGLLVSLVGSDFASARAAVAHPCNAILLAAFLIAMLWHTQLGVQVIIEDYVHTAGLAFVIQLAVRLACVLAALAGIFAILRISLGA